MNFIDKVVQLGFEQHTKKATNSVGINKEL